MPIPKIPSRLLTLDYLRGYFIVIIIIDHLSRWPSIFGLMSGHALLWVTAAEGFVIISGLLIGYIRGFKNKAQPLPTISKKLIKRAGLLYICSVISSLVYIAIIWYISLKGGAPTPPFIMNDWGDVILKTVTLQYTDDWVFFLTYYAIFLALSPIAVWLLRRGKAWLVVLISLAVLVLGWRLNNQTLQWQALFFIPSAVGYHLEGIHSWWFSLKKSRRLAATAAIWTLAASTITLSVICTFYAGNFQNFADSLNSLFAKDTISLYRLVMAFLWFTGFLLLFASLNKWIERWFGWLLGLIGSHSLTAYILHGLALCIISFFTFSDDNVLVNSLLGVIAVMIVWGLVKMPFVRAVVPS